MQLAIDRNILTSLSNCLEVGKMNEKQKLFATEYIKDMNATQAAIRAGYSENTAYSQGQRLLKKVEIKELIEQHLKTVRKQNVADTIEIEEYLTSVMRGNEKETEMINVGNFEQELVEVPVKQNTRIKAAELLGKRYSMWTDKADINLTGSVVFLNEDNIED